MQLISCFPENHSNRFRKKFPAWSVANGDPVLQKLQCYLSSQNISKSDWNRLLLWLQTYHWRRKQKIWTVLRSSAINPPFSPAPNPIQKCSSLPAGVDSHENRLYLTGTDFGQAKWNKETQGLKLCWSMNVLTKYIYLIFSFS